LVGPQLLFGIIGLQADITSAPRLAAFGPKQESNFRPVWDDQRTFAPAMGMGKADGLAGRNKAARVVLG
jgi:hypothetical protein